MKLRVAVRRIAQLEIHDATIWYERQRAGLGREFLAELRSTFERITERPTSFPIEFKGARRALTDRFRHAVYFIVETDRVRVVAVLHTSQSKRRLRGRVE